MTWVPAECTLPTERRPMRLAEFDDLFTEVRALDRPRPELLRLEFDGGLEPVLRDLTARESSCCSFFGFAIARHGAVVILEIGVPPARTGAGGVPGPRYVSSRWSSAARSTPGSVTWWRSGPCSPTSSRRAVRISPCAPATPDVRCPSREPQAEVRPAWVTRAFYLVAPAFRRLLA
jgi:hypothetical protein